MTEPTNPDYQALPDDVPVAPQEIISAIVGEMRGDTSQQDVAELAEAKELYRIQQQIADDLRREREQVLRDARLADEKAAREREAERQGRELVLKRNEALKRQSEENAARRSRELEQRRLNEIAASAKRAEQFRGAVVAEHLRQQRDALFFDLNKSFQAFHDLKFGLLSESEPNAIVVEPEPEPWSPGLAAEILKQNIKR